MPTPITPFTLFLALLSLANIFWRLLKLERSRKLLPQLRESALRDFRSTVIASDSEELRFSGEHAEIVLQEEVGIPNGTLEKSSGYTFTAYARNPSGQYFMYHFSPPHRLVKHVRPEVARTVLKDRYVDPAPCARR